jgi:hypothetical protein
LTGWQAPGMLPVKVQVVFDKDIRSDVKVDSIKLLFALKQYNEYVMHLANIT